MANTKKPFKAKLKELFWAERFSERLAGIGYLLLLATVLIGALLFWLGVL